MVSAIENWAYLIGKVRHTGPSDQPGRSQVAIEITATEDYEDMPNLLTSRVGQTVDVDFNAAPDLQVGDTCRVRARVVGPNRISGHAADCERLASPAAGHARPLLLLDIDGVLNPLTEEVPAGFRRESAGGHTFLFSSEHRQALRMLSDRFELVWATEAVAWRPDANPVLAVRYWIPELPVIDPSAEALREFVGDRPVAWVTASPDEANLEWAQGRARPTLIVRPDPSMGLTSADVAELTAFADSF